MPPIKVAQEIDSIVHSNVPPTEDSGTVDNLNNLIDELIALRNFLTEETTNKNQQQFEF